VKQVVEDYAKYPYLQRLRGPAVLVESIQDGLSRTTWSSETFAIADAWDKKQKRYIGLRGNCHVDVEAESTSLLVKPDVALCQIEAERPPTASPSETIDGSATAGITERTGGPVGTATTPAAPAKPTRFFGSVKLDPARLNRDAAQVSTEVVQHLTSLLAADVEVTIEIQAHVPSGIPENVVRTVSENCKTLKFKTQGFEQE
jgi:hypothetical protein